MSAGYRHHLPGDRRIRRILVMRWSAMGDVALASCAFQDIADAFPGCEIHLNTQPPWERLFAADPRFGHVLSFRLKEPGGGARPMLRWLREVGRRRYDAIFDLQSNDRSRILMTLLTLSGRGPRYRVGNHRRFPYNVAPPPQSQPVHALDHLRATLQAAGVDAHAPSPVLHPPARNRRRAAELMSAQGLREGRYAIFLPGCQAAGYLKRWGARRFIALGMLLARRGVERAVLVGAAEDADECAEIERALEGFAVNLCGKTELLDIVPLSEGAKFIVANDTGTAHVAAAAARPMVVVCGPTDPRRVRPAGPRVATLQAPIHCINCYRKHCSHHSCMLLVTPEQVVESLERASAAEG